MTASSLLASPMAASAASRGPRARSIESSNEPAAATAATSSPSVDGGPLSPLLPPLSASATSRRAERRLRLRPRRWPPPPSAATAAAAAPTTTSFEEVRLLFAGEASAPALPPPPPGLGLRLPAALTRCFLEVSVLLGDLPLGLPHGLWLRLLAGLAPLIGLWPPPSEAPRRARPRWKFERRLLLETLQLLLPLRVLPASLLQQSSPFPFWP
mmetsp:Transcript_103556/g.259669  ORF Transcript_103556/g.259669 Transcript_103556/m.259669 type:complete len:212 (-) Transcript_103556:702-1337(-)